MQGLYIISLRLTMYMVCIESMHEINNIYGIYWINACRVCMSFSLRLTIYMGYIESMHEINNIYGIYWSCNGICWNCDGVYWNCDGIYWSWSMIIYMELIYGMEIYDCMSFFLRLTIWAIHLMWDSFTLSTPKMRFSKTLTCKG